MNKKLYFALWGGLFAACAGLGFIGTATGFLKVLLVLLAIAFFIPGFLLLNLASKTGDRHTLALIRSLSALSLGLTLVLLVANFLSVLGSETLGSILYYVLVIVSTPMVCGQYWVLSLFLWAYLMIGSHKALKTK
ncbi:MAG: hypothetical protein J6J18_12705 [Oscillospiraceae bacterium]|nr:hypothetical protein [Oscillospiraceae bacterium]